MRQSFPLSDSACLSPTFLGTIILNGRFLSKEFHRHVNVKWKCGNSSACAVPSPSSVTPPPIASDCPWPVLISGKYTIEIVVLPRRLFLPVYWKTLSEDGNYKHETANERGWHHSGPPRDTSVISTWTLAKCLSHKRPLNEGDKGFRERGSLKAAPRRASLGRALRYGALNF